MAKHQFQTEVSELLNLIVHSLYSHREIFLRELVSNASDACDKLRFEALHNDSLFEDDSDLKSRIAYDKTARTRTVDDNGIGMNREEVIANLGTIAKSGTRDFFLCRLAECVRAHRQCNLEYAVTQDLHSVTKLRHDPFGE